MSAVENELLVTRVFDAPVGLVYRTWTEPGHVVCWWMPKGFSAPKVETMDVRTGGTWRIRMPHTDGNVYAAYGVYREVVKEKRLAWDDFCDEDGKHFHKAFVTVDFEALSAGKTRVTLRARLEDVPGRDPRWTMDVMEKGWVEGWKDNLELLASYLPKAASTADREIVLERTYDAPRELVYKVWTDPEHVVKWWGPNGFTTTNHSMDVRVGGGWRYTMHGPDGTDYPNVTTFLVVEPNERLVYDHGDDQNPRLFQASATFDDVGGKTRLTLRLVFDTAEQRDATVEKSGAIEGGKQTLARLAEFISKMN
jgi:uncharacterized protein YndB with AHSA1/START domain